MTRTPAELFDLTGKVALVTGGSRGLGRAIVLAYAAAGADVVIASRKLPACEAVAAEVEALGREALPVACHAGRWDSLDALAETAYERFGKVDVLVNNAGMSPLAPSSEQTSEELFDKVVGVNLKGWATPGEDRPDMLLRRLGHPEEIVTAALYYASDASSCTTGSLLRVDGLGPP